MTVKLFAEALQIQAETGLSYDDAMEVAIQRTKAALINQQSATQHTILTIEEVAEEIAAILHGEPSDDDASLIRYVATADKIKQRLKLALQAGKIRPRSKTDGGFDNSLAFMGARAPISLNDAIAFLKSEGVALDTIELSEAPDNNEPPQARRNRKDLATTKEIAEAFPPPKNTKPENWRKNLGDAPAWVRDAREFAGGPGTSALWNPAMFGICMVSEGHISKQTALNIIRREFSGFLDEWEEKSSHL